MRKTAQKIADTFNLTKFVMGDYFRLQAKENLLEGHVVLKVKEEEETLLWIIPFTTVETSTGFPGLNDVLRRNHIEFTEETQNITTDSGEIEVPVPIITQNGIKTMIEMGVDFGPNTKEIAASVGAQTRSIG